VLQRITFLAKDSNLVAQLVEETNARLKRRLPPLARQQRSLSRQLAEVKGQASKLLGDWATKEDGPSKAFVSDQLTLLGQRRTELESGLAEVEEKLARLKADGVTAKAVRAALGQVNELYAALQPHEQKELVSLVVRRVTVSDREIELKINGGACQLMAEAPTKTLSGG
jgi:chaperonin cofactor prefoldin